MPTDDRRRFTRAKAEAVCRREYGRLRRSSRPRAEDAGRQARRALARHWEEIDGGGLVEVDSEKNEVSPCNLKSAGLTAAARVIARFERLMLSGSNESIRGCESLGRRLLSR